MAGRQPPAEAALALVAVAVVEPRLVVEDPVVAPADLPVARVPRGPAAGGCRRRTAACRCPAGSSRSPARGSAGGPGRCSRSVRRAPGTAAATARRPSAQKLTRACQPRVWLTVTTWRVPCLRWTVTPSRRTSPAAAYAGGGDGRKEGGGQQERGEQSSHVRSSGLRSGRTPRYDGWRRRCCGDRPSDSTSTTRTAPPSGCRSASRRRHLVGERAGRRGRTAPAPP